jgi:hypothetical protein
MLEELKSYFEALGMDEAPWVAMKALMLPFLHQGSTGGALAIYVNGE